MLLRKSTPRGHYMLKAHYATIANDHWPQFSAPHRRPTPYQILNHDPEAPYSKAKFNELVKLYHPDRKDHPLSHTCSHLKEFERLERYRMIVAAHTLLGDPVKRQAYDTHGIGWLDGLEDSLLQRAAAAGGKDAYNAARNATWEDWERWREEREHGTSDDNKRAQPYYMRHGTFASMLILFSLGAAKAQSMHATRMTETRKLVREENHYKAARDYEIKQVEARKASREKRIEDFVKQKDPAVLSNQRLSELVMTPDLCESGNDLGRAREMDMKRKFR